LKDKQDYKENFKRQKANARRFFAQMFDVRGVFGIMPVHT